MKNLKSTTLAVITTGLLAAASFNTLAMSKNTELALIEVCEAAESNSLIRFNKTIKSYNLQKKEVALKVMCNGDDISEFASKAGAYKTTAVLKRSVGGVSISDIAAISKVNVKFAG